jgi:hypothetical protein
VISQAPCSNALKPLEILIRAVVTMVVSKAEIKRHSQSPAIITCNLVWLILGAVGAVAVVASPPVVVFASWAIKVDGGLGSAPRVPRSRSNVEVG